MQANRKIVCHETDCQASFQVMHFVMMTSAALTRAAAVSRSMLRVFLMKGTKSLQGHDGDDEGEDPHGDAHLVGPVLEVGRGLGSRVALGALVHLALGEKTRSRSMKVAMPATAMGNPMRANSKKPVVGILAVPSTPLTAPFGGVPMRVSVPPKEVAKARAIMDFHGC